MNAPIQHNTFAERLATIIRSIASGNNACGTLMCNGQLNIKFLEMAIAPTLRIYEDEAEMARRDLAALRHDVEVKRRALESVVANVVPPHPATLPLLREALPNHPHLT